MIQVYRNKIVGLYTLFKGFGKKKRTYKCKEEWKNPIGSGSDILMVHYPTKPDKKGRPFVFVLKGKAGIKKF